MSGYPRTLLFGLFLGHAGLAVGGDASTDIAALVGDAVAGEARYQKSCVNCHGAGGKGVASYPKVSGQDIAYTTEKLEQYRNGVKIGPNSSLMIMMAKPLTDQEIADLATYLEDA
ncbi:MAG: c-type cytochrome [Pseudomonadota bacterium]